MRVPTIPTSNFEGKAGLLFRDSHALGFVEKCSLLAVGETFLLPNGESAGTIVNVDSGYPDSELVASCSFRTDKYPFNLRIFVQAKEVATYYQRTHSRRFQRSKKYIQHIEIVVSEEVLGYGDTHPNKKITWHPFYERSERYTEDAFKTFLEGQRSSIQDGRTMYIYSEISSVEATMRIILTKDEAGALMKKSKRRWYKSYIASSSSRSSWKEQSLKVTKRPRG